jgi:acylphosphatase
MLDNSAENARVSLKVAGRVQGVYYRAAARQRAQQLGLTGWVMNCPDGSVEVIAEGAVAKLEEFIAWCREGPPDARVVDVSVEWRDAQNTFREFFIKR